jgi:arylsulfatase A-like enzyme
VRGPGVPKGQTSDIVSSHHDIAPTLLALAKGDEYIPSWVDGGVIPLTSELKNHPKPVSKESFAVEFWSLRNMAEYVQYLCDFSFLLLNCVKKKN